MSRSRHDEVVDTHRKASTEWVHVKRMKVTPAAQRKFNAGDAADIAKNFDLEALGYPVVNFRTGNGDDPNIAWIVDGQHRVGALRIMGWDDQMIECEVYRGLTEAQEADLFLRRDRRRAVPPVDKFRIATTAGWPDETAITKILDSLDLRVGYGVGRVQAATTLLKIYRTYGPDVLGRALLLLRESFGVEGMSAATIEGMALVVHRYGNTLATDRAVSQLRSIKTGVDGLIQKSNSFHLTTGSAKPVCMAGAIVDKINAGRGGKKLPDWWREG